MGGTVGTGVFVLAGQIAYDNKAGPGVMLSFLLSALSCILSGLCFAEMASRIPTSGAS